MWHYFVETLPNFLLYFAVSVALLAAYAFAYVKVTPHQELALIKAGGTAAAISLGGALIGFALPLSTVIKFSVSVSDLILWGVVVLLVQLAAFFIARLYVSGLNTRIEQNDTAAGIFMASIALAVGILNSGCMTP
jgi:putative membrane protein